MSQIRICSFAIGIAFGLACAMTRTTWADEILLPSSQVQSQKPSTIQIDLTNLESAREAAQEIDAADPGSVHPELILASAYMQRGNVRQARALMESLAIKEPDRIDLRMSFCMLAMKEGRWFDAWVHGTAARDAKFPEKWDEDRQAKAKQQVELLLANCCEGRGDWTQALEIYETLHAELDQKEQSDLTARVLQGLGRVQFHLGELEKSVERFSQFAVLVDSVEPAELTVAKLFESQQKVKEAEEWYQRSMDSAPADTQIHFARWLIWSNQGERAQETLEKDLSALRTAPLPKTEIPYLRALADRMQGNYGQAAKSLSKLHREDPASYSVGNQLALTLIELEEESDRARALQIAESNVRNRQDDLEARATLGWVQYRLGDLQQAQAHLSIVAQGGNISRDTAFYMAELHSKLGNAQKANELYAAAQQAKGPFFYAIKMQDR